MKLHPTDLMSRDEHRETIEAIMKMNERIYKNAPRVVVNRHKDTINIICGKKKMWNDD